MSVVTAALLRNFHAGDTGDIGRGSRVTGHNHSGSVRGVRGGGSCLRSGTGLLSLLQLLQSGLFFSNEAEGIGVEVAGGVEAAEAAGKLEKTFDLGIRSSSLEELAHIGLVTAEALFLRRLLASLLLGVGWELVESQQSGKSNNKRCPRHTSTTFFWRHVVLPFLFANLLRQSDSRGFERFLNLFLLIVKTLSTMHWG